MSWRKYFEKRCPSRAVRTAGQAPIRFLRIRDRIHPQKTTLRRPALLVVGITLLAGCNGSTTAETTTTSTSTPPTTTSSTSTSTTTSTTSTTTIATTVPTVPVVTNTPGTDWTATINALLVRYHDLFANPDTADVASYCEVPSTCSENFEGPIAEWKRLGQHTEGADPLVVTSIDSVRELPGGRFDITFSYAVGATGNVVDGNGNVVYVLDPPAADQQLQQTWLLHPYPEDPVLPWRLTSTATS